MVAVLLGVLFGVGLLAPLLMGYRFLVADRIDVGLAVVMGAVFGGLLVALGVLFGYRALAPSGLIWFGPALVGGYVLGLGAFALKAARTLLKPDGRDEGDSAWRS